MKINEYLGMVFEHPPCWPLVAKVYEAELGYTFARHRASDGSLRSSVHAFSLGLRSTPDCFVRLADPVDFCIVFLGRRPSLGPHHCGVYWHGSVLHARTEGTLYESLSTIRDQYKLIEFWGLA